jgi:hypothetical protein
MTTSHMSAMVLRRSPLRHPLLPVGRGHRLPQTLLAISERDHLLRECADRHARHTRRNLFEKLRPFPAQRVFELHEACDVAAWARKATNVPGTNRVDGLSEYDGHSAARASRCFDRLSPSRQDEIRRQCNQFRRISVESLGSTSSPANLEPDVASLAPPQLLESLPKCRNVRLRFRILRARIHENADAPHPILLLRARRDRPRRCR